MPRPLRLLLFGLAGLGLVLFFLERGFPYARFADLLESRVGLALDARVEVAEVGPWPTLAGPGLVARGVRARFTDGRRLELERAALRPAWSLAWLLGRPAFHVELEGPSGAVEGTWISRRGWDGELRGVDLSLLPLGAWWPGGPPQGRVDARIDLRLTEDGPEGGVRFEAHGGVLPMATLPVPLRYDSLRGELVLGGSSLVEVVEFFIESPLFSGRGRGEVGQAAVFSEAPLRLDFEVEKSAAAMHPALRAAGVRLARNGAARVQITGTPSAPSVHQGAGS